MDSFEPGDVVVLKSGSMRMLVETVAEDGAVAVLWANDGGIGRDTLPAFALKKWEERPPRGDGDDRGARPYGGPHKGGGKPYGPKGGKPPFPAKGGPKGPVGMDGKPRQKTHFRKDG